MKAYFYDNLPGDQRLPHDSGRSVDVETLSKLGVLYYCFPNLQDVDKLATDRGYKNRDEVTVSPESMGEAYENKVKTFFCEHLHEDEEIRYIKDGQGFFDVRSKEDEWIRVRLEKNDLLILPAGIYHRFTTEEKNIFGGSGHMGRSLVKHALSQGDLVTSVGKAYETDADGMATVHENCLGSLCDVRSRESVALVVQKTLDNFRRIDVVANCSGYGVIGSCEDQDEHDLRNQFETNFIGTLHIIHTTLSYFRRQNAGRYLIFSSTSGALGVPGLGPYCATKYAVEGLIEAMLYETDFFNIKATLIEPGLVRRDELDTNASSPSPTWEHFLIKSPSAEYAPATSPALHAQRLVQWLGDRQPTSAVNCAELVWQLAHCSFPPLRLLLGSYAIESIRDRMRSVTEELEDWKHLNFTLDAGDSGEGCLATDAF
ncbi:hypothetical protein E4U43_007350 [Claviceps pusilla]|uniref:Acireductone dioxygenase n=1 Tax=Claviceps pusilla TaxID=123648 RepID=A0A9P7NHJ8_9HYPO|nr:hypothetical protein E4U43_007350 [Claviceps pusilla]